jgi:hypothetical protein
MSELPNIKKRMFVVLKKGYWETWRSSNDILNFDYSYNLEFKA